MLPEDSKARQEAVKATMTQSQVNTHFHKLDPSEWKILYLDEVFKTAAIEWLIQTNQPIQAFEHPSFINMMNIALQATCGIKLPNCKQTRESIIELFRDQMGKLQECLAHIINLATQALILTRSKAKYYNPHQIDEHLPDTSLDVERDELGLIWAIVVKECSSSQRKALFKDIQVRDAVENTEAKASEPLQLLLDMKVCWGSTYIMLHRAELLRQ
ncbi:hypothetical protein C0991_012142, partial [Blastosporella zonata]